MLRRLADLVFPPACLSCRAVGGWLCGQCRGRLTPVDGGCPRCAGPRAPARRDCADCRRLRPVFASARAVAVYEGVARDALMAFKIGGERRAAGHLAAMMVDASAGLDGAFVTFVPSTRRALAARGFNPARELARHVARALDVPCLPLLRKVRETADQAGLSREQRSRNLAGAFTSAPARGTALLIDDIMTTGATAQACSRALMDAGIAKVGILTFARAI